MVSFILGCQALEDLHGLLLRWLGHVHGLEAALQCRIFFDVLAVLIDRRRANALELPTGQCRLQQVRGIDAAPLCTSAATGTDESVDLVYNQDYTPVAVCHLLHNSFEPLFKVTTIASARQQQGHVNLDNDLIAECHGHATFGDALCQTMRDGRLANTCLSQEHGVVLGPATKDADRALELILASNQRVQLAFTSHCCEILAVLQGLFELHILQVASSRWST
mmetsp:Transcript_109211/g.273568  ORF Transcript_109211/g.273568 Transcript_109211/m.273568 type:complete len:222 (+) Transcript_109211:1190-1855(+)